MVAMGTPFFASCPHTRAYCLLCCQLALTLHLNIAYREVNTELASLPSDFPVCAHKYMMEN